MGRVFQHEIGRRHTQNITSYNRNTENRTQEERRDESEVMEIAPGEPAPPGFEEIRTSQIQVSTKEIDNFNRGSGINLVNTSH